MLTNFFHHRLRRNKLTRGALALLFFAAGLFAALPLVAQPSEQTVSSNRFLFIVDTSAAMKRDVKETVQVVGEIINSGANGQMHRGDTLGLWTFNEQVASELPVQRWDAEARGRNAARTAEFLQRHAYQNSSRLESFLPDMLNIIKNSDVIMVFIISNGDGKIKGTPFDREINESLAASIRDMQGKRSPIVTILVAKGGNIIRYTVNPLPWPIVIPELPAPTPPTVASASTKPKVTPAPSQTPTPAPTVSTKPVPPLIVTKPESARPLTNSTPTQTPTPVVTEPPKAVPPPDVSKNAITADSQPQAITKNDQQPSQPATPPAIVKATPQTTPAPESALAPPPVQAVPAPVQLAGSVKPTAPQEKISAPVVAASNSFTNDALGFVAPEPGARSHVLLIAAAALILIALALIVMMVRRSQTTSGPSLITRSMGNKKR